METYFGMLMRIVMAPMLTETAHLRDGLMGFN